MSLRKKELCRGSNTGAFARRAVDLATFSNTVSDRGTGIGIAGSDTAESAQWEQLAEVVRHLDAYSVKGERLAIGTTDVKGEAPR